MGSDGCTTVRPQVFWGWVCTVSGSFCANRACTASGKGGGSGRCSDTSHLGTNIPRCSFCCSRTALLFAYHIALLPWRIWGRITRVLLYRLCAALLLGCCIFVGALHCHRCTAWGYKAHLSELRLGRVLMGFRTTVRPQVCWGWVCTVSCSFCANCACTASGKGGDSGRCSDTSHLGITIPW